LPGTGPAKQFAGARRIGGVLALAIALACLPTSTASASLAPPQIHTVAGGGSCSGAITSGGPCDGVAATSGPIGGARSVSALPDGGYLYIDSANDLVREVSPSGIVTTVAGTSRPGPNNSEEPDVTDVDGVPAIDSGLDDPVSVAALPSGGFLITEFAGSRVRLVSPGTPGTATITTIAGIPPGPNGIVQPGDNGNSGPGTSIELNYPSDAEPTAAGEVLIADTYNDRIMLLSSTDGTGTIQEIAGGGSCQDANADCDGLQAGNVGLYLPDSASEIPNGSGAYLFSEYGADAVREVSQESLAGTFDTVAGEPGSPGYSGDDGSATDAQLTEPEQVSAAADGSFLIADAGNDVVREVSAQGIISTVAGDGIASFAGDGGDATAGSLNDPASVSPLANGNILIADDNNDRIREITLPPVSTIALKPSSPNGNNGWYVTDPTVTVSADESAMTQCELDPAAAPPAYGAIEPGCPYAGTGATVTDGMHTVYAASQNAFGDQENPISLSFKVDATPPTIACSAEPVFEYGDQTAQVLGTLSDAVSGPASATITQWAYTGSFGMHNVQLTGTNNAGLWNVYYCPYFVTVRTFAPQPAGTTALQAAGSKLASVRSLVISQVPAWANVTVTCKGAGCPFASRSHVRTQRAKGKHASGERTADLARLFGHAKLAYGTVISVAVTAPGTVGRYLTFTVRAGRNASLRSACLAPGVRAPNRERCVPKSAVPK
jgi:hypothetical protein